MAHGDGLSAVFVLCWRRYREWLFITLTVAAMRGERLWFYVAMAVMASMVLASVFVWP